MTAISDIKIPKEDRTNRAAAIDWRPQYAIMGVIALVAAVDLAWLWATPMELDWAAAADIFLIPCLLSIICIVYLRFRPEPRIAATTLILAELFAFAVPGVTLSYLTTSLGQPMIDDTLARWDAMMGFDWLGYTRYVEAHPGLYTLQGLLYISSRYQIGFLIALFGFTGRSAQATHLVATLIISAIVTSVIGGLFPALGGYDNFGLPAPEGSDFADAITAFHSGQMHLINFKEVKGIITFPSYHTAISVALILASWPYRYIRYPMLTLNVALFASIPVIGAHYLSDMIAGAAIVFIVDQALRLISRHNQTSLAN